MATAPGWHVDDRGVHRWWDGYRWGLSAIELVRSGETIYAAGHTGQVAYDGTWITITRRGLLARGSVGKGEKRIPVTALSAVQWKPPGHLVNGFIQFTLAGGNERRSQFGRQTRDAVKDESSVVVTSQQARQFLALREAIEDGIAHGAADRRPAPSPSSAGPPPGFYAAPDGRGTQWWDGQRWTEHRQ